jgi:hypothetical protein
MASAIGTGSGPVTRLAWRRMRLTSRPRMYSIEMK